jgi:hypothetical protein
LIEWADALGLIEAGLSPCRTGCACALLIGIPIFTHASIAAQYLVGLALRRGHTIAIEIGVSVVASADRFIFAEV